MCKPFFSASVLIVVIAIPFHSLMIPLAKFTWWKFPSQRRNYNCGDAWQPGLLPLSPPRMYMCQIIPLDTWNWPSLSLTPEVLKATRRSERWTLWQKYTRLAFFEKLQGLREIEDGMNCLRVFHSHQEVRPVTPNAVPCGMTCPSPHFASGLVPLCSRNWWEGEQDVIAGRDPEETR